MTSAIQFITPPNPTVSPAAGPAPVEPVRKDLARKEPVRPSDQNADLRLIIEEDKDGVGFIYKTLDRRTGEVVQVFPQDDLLKLKDISDYSPGSVVDQRT